MSIVTLSPGLLAVVGGQGYGQARYDSQAFSDVTGAADTEVYGPPRWRASLQAPQWLTLAEAGEWEALVLKLRGGINHLALYDLLRPAPRGTMRGTPVLAAPVAVGDTTAVLDNVIGTLERGDWLGLGSGLGASQVVKIVEPVASAVSAPAAFTWDNGGTFVWSNGGTFVWDRPGAQVTITFEPPARSSYGAFALVGWDKPLTYYKQVNGASSWQAVPNGPSINGFALDLLEQWT